MDKDQLRGNDGEINLSQPPGQHSLYTRLDLEFRNQSRAPGRFPAAEQPEEAHLHC